MQNFKVPIHCERRRKFPLAKSSSPPSALPPPTFSHTHYFSSFPNHPPAHTSTHAPLPLFHLTGPSHSSCLPLTNSCPSTPFLPSSCLHIDPRARRHSPPHAHPPTHLCLRYTSSINKHKPAFSSPVPAYHALSTSCVPAMLVQSFFHI